MYQNNLIQNNLPIYLRRVFLNAGLQFDLKFYRLLTYSSSAEPEIFMQNPNVTPSEETL